MLIKRSFNMFKARAITSYRRFFSSNIPNNQFKFPIWKSLGVFVATGAGLWLYYRNERNKILEKRMKNEENAGSVGTPFIGGPFELVTTEGEIFSDKDLLGKYYLLYFGFTHCPDVCPEELSKIADIVKRVNRDENKTSNTPLLPVFITCDPERDTPEVIKSYLKDFGSDFIGLTGPSDVIKSVAKSFRVYYRPTQTSDSGDYLVDHSIYFYLMGPDGKFINNFGRDSTAGKCAEMILNEMKRGQEMTN